MKEKIKVANHVVRQYNKDTGIYDEEIVKLLKQILEKLG